MIRPLLSAVVLAVAAVAPLKAAVGVGPPGSGGGGGGGGGSSNMVVAAIGVIDSTNAFLRGVTNITANTASIDWNGPSQVRYAPTATFTLSFVNTPSPGSPAREMEVALLTSQSGAWPAGIDWFGGAPAAQTGITNYFRLRWTQTNVVGFPYQGYGTGSGASVSSNAPVISDLLVRSTLTLTNNGGGAGTMFIPAIASAQTTNMVGLVHKSSAATLVLDANESHRFSVTNRITAATSLVLTNSYDGQEITAVLLGEISGGTSRAITLIPHLGHLAASLDGFTALATSASFTLTNGNAVEISDRIVRLNGTNVHCFVTRQFSF